MIGKLYYIKLFEPQKFKPNNNMGIVACITFKLP